MVNRWRRADYYQAFLKGVAKPNDVQFGNLGVQVLAVQSGGLAIESNSDVTGNIQRCLTESSPGTKLPSIHCPPTSPTSITTSRSSSTSRDSSPGPDGYYSNPQIIEPQH